jgi:hypothetical protein
MRGTGAGGLHGSLTLQRKEFVMRLNPKAWLYIALSLLIVACGHQRARSEKNFDKIREMVKGKTSSEIEQMLGKPDSKQEMLSSGERWIWWNYTFLGGNNYPPELRDKVVHLEIIFEPDDMAGVARASSTGELRASGPFGVSYTLPPETK